jgi:hypothetical protein
MISHDTRINDVRMSSSNGSLTGFYFQLEREFGASHPPTVGTITP